MRRTWTEAEILDAMQAWTDRFGAPPIVLDWAPHLARANGQPQRAELFEREHPAWPHSRTVVVRFGSWNAALRALGERHTHRGVWRTSPRHRHTPDGEETLPWSREEVIEVLQAEHERTGQWPTSLAWTKADPEGLRPTAETVKLLFGSWSAAIRAAGGEPLARSEITTTRTRRQRIRELLASRPDITIKEIAAELGTTPGVVSRHMARMREAGETHIRVRRNPPRWTRERILELILADRRELGRWPLLREWEERPDRPSAATVRRHGGMRTLLREAKRTAGLLRED